jgi:hypothetical protein
MPDAQDYFCWRRRRHEFKATGSAKEQRIWQHDYMARIDAQGNRFPEHQRRLHLREFDED